MLGTLLCVGAQGLTIEDFAPSFLDSFSRHRIGGFICFSYNIIQKSQIQTLISELKSIHKLWTCIDQEGGRVQRLPWVQFSSAKSQKYDEYPQIASSLKSIGIDCNLAPVVDVDMIPSSPVIGGMDRSFSTDPYKVVEMARLYIEAHRKQGIKTCLKHFPGHGSADGDTHEGLCDITNTFRRDIELLPYINLLDSGHVDAIMPGHLVHKQWDPRGVPMTLSHAALTKILRKTLGFSGVVLSDAMDMGAIAEHYPLEKAVIEAIKAGVDCCIISNHPAARKKRGVEKAIDTAGECCDLDLLITAMEKAYVHDSIFRKAADAALSRMEAFICA